MILQEKISRRTNNSVGDKVDDSVWTLMKHIIWDAMSTFMLYQNSIRIFS